MKIKMFGFLKQMLGKPTQPQADWEEMSDSGNGSSVDAAFSASHPRAISARAAAMTARHSNGKGVEVPVQKILSELPLELQPRVLLPEVGDMTISIPLEKVLAQLSRGVVKISFGELRMAAQGVFSPNADRDRVLVALPLADILAQLNPALITCRRNQREVEVPENVSSPFEAYGGSTGFEVSGPVRAEAPPLSREISPPPAAPAPPPVPATPLAPSRAAVSFSNLAVPPARPAQPTRLPIISQQIHQALPPEPKHQSPPAEPSHAVPAPVGPAQPEQPVRLKLAEETAAAAKAPEEPTAPPILIALSALAETWPETVRKEIVELSLVDARVALPSDKVEQALRMGRIAFSWKTLRSWIRHSNLLVASPHENIVLELPLKVVAPLFLARKQESGRSQQDVPIDEEIPDLFFGQGQAAPVPAKPVGNATAAQPEASAPATPPQKPADTNYYIWNDSSDVVCDRDLDAGHSSPGTRFITKYATPNEIVSRAAALNGICGALIALPDGLMVANQLPPDVNADTLAAFLPQIFGKVSACTKELRMGELNNLNFTVGNVPWKIFRVNAIFFAAFGRAGQPLPTGQLAALAAELDHKPK